MPRRIIALGNNYYYHVFNRSINNETIFKSESDYKRAIGTIKYYRLFKPPIKFSIYLKFESVRKAEILSKIENSLVSVSIICYCLMPDHYHFLLRQENDNGISKFMANFQNSFTKYINTKYERTGHLFGGQFKAVRIPNNDLLLHISRYIHLNPYSSNLVNSDIELVDYPFSSFGEFVDIREELCDRSIITKQFSNPEKYKNFVLNHKDYQRNLKRIRKYTIS